MLYRPCFGLLLVWPRSISQPLEGREAIHGSPGSGVSIRRECRLIPVTPRWPIRFELALAFNVWGVAIALYLFCTWSRHVGGISTRSLLLVIVAGSCRLPAWRAVRRSRGCAQARVSHLPSRQDGLSFVTNRRLPTRRSRDRFLDSDHRNPIHPRSHLESRRDPTGPPLAVGTSREDDTRWSGACGIALLPRVLSSIPCTQIDEEPRLRMRSALHECPKGSQGATWR